MDRSVLLWLCLAAVGCLAVEQTARTKSTGDLRIPCQSPCAAASIDSTKALSDDCAASATADLPARWRLPQHPDTWPNSKLSDKRRGPHLNVYPQLDASQVAKQCNPTAWAWYRLMRAVNDTIALDLNYCHHHAPDYVTPESVRVVCKSPDPEPGCVCSAGGLGRSKPWQGLDCSNFVAWILNFAFGFYSTSSIGEQACHPTYTPGRLLSTVGVSQLNLLRPGDLVFITLGKKGRTAPVRVSHMVVWTGYTVDMKAGATGPLSRAALLSNLHSYERSNTESCMNERASKGLPVYVIADSHNNGPAFRPFCGWYLSSFSHARRVIDPATTLPTNANSVAYYDEASGDCMSMWALQG